MSMSANSEVLLISAVLKTQDHITPFAEGITTRHFHTFQTEWEFITEYVGKHRRVPSISAFKHAFPNTKLYKVDDVAHFIEKVREEHARHELIDLIGGITSDLRDEMPATDLLARLHSGLLTAHSGAEGESELYEITSHWSQTYGMVRDRAARAEELGTAGIPTGFDTLDLATGGIQPGHYWVIAGRTGKGKTWMMVRAAVTAMLMGFKVQYFSLEQGRHQIALRVHTFLSSEAGKEVFLHTDLQHAKGFRLVQYKKFLKNLKDEVSGKFFINDTSRGLVSPLTIAAAIERVKPDIVFVDYLTLMATPAGEDWQGVAKLSESIKRIAEQYQLPVVVAAQINRQGTGSEPPLSEHLSRSDAIGQDADAVVTLAQKSMSVTKMRLAKYRHGRDGQTWFCKFNPDSGELHEITGDHAMDLIKEDMESSV